MRVAVVSDIHGNLSAIEAVMADIDALDPPVDTIVSTGDTVGHFAHPNEVIDLLRSRQAGMIRGNYDEASVGLRQDPGADYVSTRAEEVDLAAVRWTKQNLSPENVAAIRSWSKDLRLAVARSGRPATALRESENPERKAKRGVLTSMLVGEGLIGMAKQPKSFMPKQVLFVHGSPRDVVEYLYAGTPLSILRAIAGQAEADVIVHGHTHESSRTFVPELQQHRVKRGSNEVPAGQDSAPGVTFVGVGSVGRSAMRGMAEYAVLEFINEQVDIDFRSVEYDSEREASAIDSSELPGELAQLIRTGQLPFQQTIRRH